MGKVAVVAVGGNSLIKRALKGEAGTWIVP